MLLFQDLIDHLEGVDVYVVMPRGWNGRDKPFETLDSVCEAYSQAILNLNVKAAHHFLGYCFGGILGFELACRLGRTKSIGFVGVIESFGPQKKEGDSRPQKSSFIHRHCRKALKLGIPKYIGDRVAAKGRMMKKSGNRFICDLLRHLGMDVPFFWRESHIQFHDLRMEKSYAGTYLSGDVVLFWSEHDPDWDWIQRTEGKRVFDFGAALENWRRFVGGQVEVVSIPGDHVSMLRGKNAAVLAEFINLRTKEPRLERPV